ncbi:MAG: DUF86 domain-containing protein [Phycisphaerae bacterium]
MLDHAREAVEMAAGRSREDLDHDRQLNLALVRLLEVIGEAASRVPPEECRRRPGIPWRDVVGLRNRLIHGYDDVNFDILWTIVQDDLPPLGDRIETGDGWSVAANVAARPVALPASPCGLRRTSRAPSRAAAGTSPMATVPPYSSALAVQSMGTS